MAKATFRYEAGPSVNQTARGLRDAAREMRRLILATMRANEAELREPFESFAPYDAEERDSYHMQDHITVTVAAAGRIQATVKVEAISPESGFDYLDVTRYGHRGTLTPRRGTFLKWTSGGVTYYARETAGHHPATDWVEDAEPAAEQAAGDIADRVGRVVYTRLLA